MMIYLLISAFLIPLNIWAALTPHLHSELSMRILHLSSSAVLFPVLYSIWQSRRDLLRPLAAVYAVFLVVMVVVNLWITAMGMGVEKGWLDHLLLSLAAASVVLFYLLVPESSSRSAASGDT